jgi:hypothetical protein
LNELYEIIGAIHLHSVYSDGTWSISKIAEAANEVGLDFLLFSDHQTLAPKQAGYQGFYGKTAVLIGYETSDETDCNHYLVFQLDEIAPGLYAQEYVTEVASRGGLGIIAHPMEKRDALEDFPPYPWTAWHCEEFQGIEIWNQLSEWMDGLTKTNKLRKVLHPLGSTISPPPELLRRWDDLALKRKVVGIAGIDAHSFEIPVLKIFKVRIFHYKVMMKSLRNHLLLNEPFPRKDFAKAEKAIFDTIRAGRLFFSNHRRGEAEGFRFYAESENKIADIGDSIHGNKVHFIVESPADAELAILRNGEVIVASGSKHLEYITGEPGAYRAEARKGGHAWVFSNHIIIKYSE